MKIDVVEVGGLEKALKLLQRDFMQGGVKFSLKRHEAHTKPGERRRLKSLFARKRAAKNTRRQALAEVRRGVGDWKPAAA